MKTRNRNYTMSAEEYNEGEFVRRELNHEYEEPVIREERREEEASRRSRSKTRSEKSSSRGEPSTPSSHSHRSESRKKSKKSKRKRHRSEERDRVPQANENMSNTDLLANLTSYFEGRFKEIKQELKEENQALHSQMNKRFKMTEHSFKKNGNKYQYHHNIEVATRVEEAQSLLNKNPPEVKKARDALSEGMDIIEERNKDIMVADTSEGGWDTVNEYRKKQIAEDSEDDKKLRKADTNATRKKEQKRKKHKQTQQRKWQQPYYPRNDYNYNEQYSRRDNRYESNNRQQKPFNSHFNRYGECFSCKGTDHWRRDCPYTRNRSSGHYSSNNY